MKEANLNYYILFETYTQGMQLQQYLRAEKIPSRIAPTPRSIQGELGCGMSILLTEEHVGAARECIRKHQAVYHDMVSLPCQINPKRDRYC